MTTLAPETQARQALIAMLAAEFSHEAFPIRDDKLHASVGDKGTVLAVYPDYSEPAMANYLVNDMYFIVQFYGRYDLKVDPYQSVSPTQIEGYATRFRTALRTRRPDPNTEGVWYFTLRRIMYVDDPTGNKTRFEATVLARGNNGAQLAETG